MHTYRLTLAYDGSPFAGWAAQPGLRTVQGEVEAALERILRQPAALAVAGRTDSGVHAWGQVASFATEVAVGDDLPHRLNAVLPEQISVLAVDRAPAGFDARRSARSRLYCYRLLASPASSPFERGRALWWPRPLERQALDACAAATVGRHDFTAFTPADSEHVRFERDVSRCEWLLEDAPWVASGELTGLWIEADAFLRNMVRVLVGTMLEVGSGRRTAEDFAVLLEGAPRPRAGETAPPHGLYLASVSY